MNAPLARLHDLPDGQPTGADGVVDGVEEPLILLRHGDAVDAFLNVCPHAGRRLDYAPGRFLLSREGHLVCAAHGASFATASGECVAGPCKGASLRRVAVRVEGGDVVLG